MQTYVDEHLSLIAYPMGGMGAGTICMQGTGALGNVSIRNRPDYRNDPLMFSAITVKGKSNVSRVLEAPVPSVNIFARHPDSGLGLTGKNYGLPRYARGAFTARFPFAEVLLQDETLPISTKITGWSPFIPNDEDRSSLPCCALEYTFYNTTDIHQEGVFYFCAENFLRADSAAGITPLTDGFVLYQPPTEDNPTAQAAFCATIDRPACIDSAWLRPAKGGWSFDMLTLVWKNIRQATCESKTHVDTEFASSPGATLATTFSIPAGDSYTITLRLCWYVPKSDLFADTKPSLRPETRYENTYAPWYSKHFADIFDVAQYWEKEYAWLRRQTLMFTDCFYDTTLPAEIIDAASANLCILKSPTVLRQTDGRLWAWEGCHDDRGCCPGSCTHVWNYAQAICHLFPRMERSLRETEFNVSQLDNGYQTFRTRLPIEPIDSALSQAAADGQLGGIIKVFRDWRISGDTKWLQDIWPKVKRSLDYCISTWDPKREGILIEPHHNTYDIEFWGADSLCTGFYLSALCAACEMAKALKEPYEQYEALHQKGQRYMEDILFNGEYFCQNTQWEGLDAKLNLSEYPLELQEIMVKEGPRYQYGTGCLSDAVLGILLAELSGLASPVSNEKVIRTLRSIHRYNYRADLSFHANPQRPGYALGKEGGLLLCSWPREEKPSLPFVYSDEVWTGIEYQVACHLLSKGFLQESLQIIRTCRARYDGKKRNPFNEYECGHWYARALSSYALLQGYTGLRYDAVTETLHVSHRNEHVFRAFLCTARGYGTVEVHNEHVSIDVMRGSISIKSVVWET